MKRDSVNWRGAGRVIELRHPVLEAAVKRSFSSKVGLRLASILLAIVTLTGSAASSAAVFVSVQIGPPALPVYEQPLIPGPGYIWTPGYWAWGPDGYYWVPGTWVLAPFVGALWTPGYWGWSEGVYFWHAGYWGRHVGFYGGINYGCGYTGVGYEGGRWEGREFHYNRAVNNVNVVSVHNTYNTTIVERPASRVAFNGGPGGLTARPTPQDQVAAREPHTPLLAVQAHHELAASSNRELLASVNHGQPAMAALQRPARPAPGAPAARSFSQQAAAAPHPVAPHPAAPRPGAAQIERRNAPAMGGAPRPQGPPPAAMVRPAPPPQVQMRPQGQPQAQMRPQAQPQGQPQGGGHPAHEGQGSRGVQEERRRPF
jgi:hypothetical protein